MDKKEIITRIAEKIKTQYQPQKIILFGSYAWGNPTKDSDLDLLILKKTNEKHMFVPCAHLFGFEPHYHLDEANAQNIEKEH